MGCGASKVAAEPPVVASVKPAAAASTGGAKVAPVPAEVIKPEELQPENAPLQEDALAAAMEASQAEQAAAEQLARKPDWIGAEGSNSSKAAGGSVLPPLKGLPPIPHRLSAGFNPRRSAGGGAMDERPLAVRMSQPGVVDQEEDEPEPAPTDILGPSPEVAAALAAAAAKPAVAAEPAEEGAPDPWSALQAQYRPASGEAGAAGAPTSAGSAHRSSAAGGRAGRAPGSKRTTKEEMVLVDGSDGSGDEGIVMEGAGKKKGRGKPAAASAGPVKGGWGAGDLAAAGTIMTGAEEEEEAGGAAAAKDGVFDESEDEGRAKGHSAGGAGKGAAHAKGGAQHGAEVLGMEEVEDLDESAAAEMAAAGAMSKDLAAKLAQFEAMEADE